MSAALSVSAANWQAGFLSVLPVVQTHARIQFRHLPASQREEAIQEAICAACQSYQLAASRGQLHVAHPSTLANFAVRHVLEGRHVGGSQDAAKDVLSPTAQRRYGFQVTDHTDRAAIDEWQCVLLTDRKAKAPIPDLVACRIDFARWMRSWSKRDRKIIRALASGEKAGAVAERFSLSNGRVSQLRRKFEHNWGTFQGEFADAA